MNFHLLILQDTLGNCKTSKDNGTNSTDEFAEVPQKTSNLASRIPGISLAVFIEDLPDSSKFFSIIKNLDKIIFISLDAYGSCCEVKNIRMIHFASFSFAFFVLYDTKLSRF